VPRTEHHRPEFSETVVHLASEYWPYARTGGLGEAVRGIARYQAESGVPTMAVIPLHRRVRENFPWIESIGELTVPVADRLERASLHRLPTDAGAPEIFFIGNDAYFDREGLYGDDGGAYPDNHHRFAFYCRAALEALPILSPGRTLIHAHDWHAALAPIYLRTTLADHPFFDTVSSVMTVHNGGFQGYYAPTVLDELGIDPRHYHWQFLEWHGQVNLLKGALVCADMVTTVSPTHAKELCTGVGGFGLDTAFTALGDRFVGILNGIELDLWDPSDDPELPRPYGPDCLDGKALCKKRLQQECGFATGPQTPIVGLIARLVRQKGLDLILSANVLDLPAQWVFLGHGERHYHERLRALAAWAPDRVVVQFDFTEEFEHRLLGGADILLMPSLYEPCGLTQMRSQRYGALPVARRVGGLADTIEDGVTGFLFDQYQPWALREALEAALALYADPTAWRERMSVAMRRDFGWTRSVAEYHDVYRRAVARRASRPSLPSPS
jgi:starch synthase